MKQLSDAELIGAIRILRMPAYGLTKTSPYLPISRIHMETLAKYEAIAKARNLKP